MTPSRKGRFDIVLKIVFLFKGFLGFELFLGLFQLEKLI